MNYVALFEALESTFPRSVSHSAHAAAERDQARCAELAADQETRIRTILQDVGAELTSLKERYAHGMPEQTPEQFRELCLNPETDTLIRLHTEGNNVFLIDSSRFREWFQIIDRVETTEQRLAETAFNCPSCGRHDFGLWAPSIKAACGRCKTQAEQAENKAAVLTETVDALQARIAALAEALDTTLTAVNQALGGVGSLPPSALVAKVKTLHDIATRNAERAEAAETKLAQFHEDQVALSVQQGAREIANDPNADGDET